jgi:hypothetical protein
VPSQVADGNSVARSRDSGTAVRPH